MKKHTVAILDAIGPWGCTAKGLMADIAARGDAEEIELQVNSPGGDVIEGLGMFNALMACPVTVNAKITAFAASMATVVTCAAKKVTMPKNGYFVIHNPWSCVCGDSSDLAHTSDVLASMQKMVCGIYAAKTGKDAKDLQAMMDAETWMTGEEAKSAGFVDDVEDLPEMAACISPAMAKHFAKMPEGAKALVMPMVDVEAKLKAEHAAKMEAAAIAHRAEITAAVTDAISSATKKQTEDLATANALVKDLQAAADAHKAELAALNAAKAEIEGKLNVAMAVTAKFTAGLQVHEANTAAKPKTWYAAVQEQVDLHPDWDGGRQFDAAKIAHPDLYQAARGEKK